MAINPNVKYRDVKLFSKIKEILQNAVDEAGDKIAYKYFTKSGDVKESTFRSFQLDTFALGTALTLEGMADKHVAMMGTNSYEYLVLYLTMMQSEGVFVPIDKELPEADLLNILRDSDAAMTFCTERYVPMLRANRDTLPNIKLIVVIDADEDDGEFVSFRTFIEKGRAAYEAGDHRFLDCNSDPAEMKLLVYTSGTTGMAKGVMLSEHNLVCCASYGLEIVHIEDTCLSILPYNHTYEAVCGIILEMLNHTTLYINDNLRHVLKNLQLFKPECIYVVPAFAEMFYKKIWSTAKATGKELILKAGIASSNAMRKIGIDKRASLFKNVHEAFGGNLKTIICGGAPLRPELGEFFDSIGITLVNGYGITECSPLVSVNQGHNNDPSTVGFPLRCVDVKLDGLTDDGIGEVCVKGDTVMLGYYKQPALTREVIDADGYFHTGDYGSINELGQLSITGRKKNLIVLDNGKNIFPEEIEGYLAAIPYVQEVIVFGIKNEDGNEFALGAELFLSAEKLEELDIKEPEVALKRDIAKACKSLPAYKRIVQFFVRPTEFEKTTTNKIKRSCLMFANASLREDEMSN